MPPGIVKAPETLPPDAQELYLAQFDIHYNSTCLGGSAQSRYACAARQAWKAVKVEWKKSGGKWINRHPRGPLPTNMPAMSTAERAEAEEAHIAKIKSLVLAGRRAKAKLKKRNEARTRRQAVAKLRRQKAKRVPQPAPPLADKTQEIVGLILAATNEMRQIVRESVGLPAAEANQ